MSVYHLAVAEVLSRYQRCRPISGIFGFPPFNPSFFHGGLFAVQGLDTRFLVYADDMALLVSP